jgi:hypothetical protein
MLQFTANLPMRGGLLNRRDFLIRAFQVGGLAALASLGVSPKEARAVAGHHLGFMQPEAPAGCDTVFFENTSAHDDIIIMNADAERVYVGQSGLTTAADGNMCKVSWIFTKGGANSITGFNFVCQVWTLDGTALDTKQGESEPIAGVNEWSGTTVTFEFSTPVPLYSASGRAVVIARTDAGYSSTAYISASYSSAGGLAGNYRRWAADKTTTTGATIDFRITGYK